MKHSCGAILYTYSPEGKLGVILGMEGCSWLPFKGCNNPDESYEDTAIREIYEETGGLIKIKNIILEHTFNSKHKHYHIGLCYVPHNIINNFNQINRDNLPKAFVEKNMIKFFPLNELRKSNNVHNITMSSIKFFWNKLIILSYGNKQIYCRDNERLRKHSVCKQYAQNKYNSRLNTNTDINQWLGVPLSNNLLNNGKYGYNKNNNLNNLAKKSQDVRTYSKLPYVKFVNRRMPTMLKQCKSYNISNTPNQERYSDMHKVWRAPIKV